MKPYTSSMSCVLIPDCFFFPGGWGEGGGTVEEDSPCDYMFHKAEGKKEEKNEEKKKRKKKKKKRKRGETKQTKKRVKMSERDRKVIPF